jgi:exonuclease III
MVDNVIMDINISNVTYTLINVYGPNNECPEFFRNLDRKLDNFVCDNIIFGGDFNCVMNLSIDKKGGRNRTNHNAQREILSCIVKRNLLDIWRQNHPGKSQYTWRSNHDPPIMCRLDFFFLSLIL